VNLIMRYNPLCEIVRKIVERGVLGEPLHAHFENDAKDEPLPPEHWFWDREKSGGIFIEHGVHFFDLFEWWFGPGKVLAAQQASRPETSIIEHVNCTVLYRDSAFANFYHGFHQPARGDHQEWKLVFEMGSISMREWVPTAMRIDLLADDATMEALTRSLPCAEVQVIERYTGAARKCTSRHRPREVDGHFSISSSPGLAKMDLYGHMLRALLRDQIAAIRDPAHVRRISELNGATSLAAAVAAQRLADGHPERA
ncbi:MAG: Gfo/Idh/MocA family oxidoreductase, partial [Verrucomicrobiota bacterium]|nr:Gfo/Idh/MocA family oxidoreductase [Verrucomicrobiota bacterium]